MRAYTLYASTAMARPDQASMNEIISQPLLELQSLSQSLFLSLSPPQSKPPPPPSITSFLACDAALASAIQLARLHQTKQRRIERLKEDVLDLEDRWREICKELEGGKRELEAMIEEGKERCKAIEEAKTGLSRMFFRPNACLTLSA